MTRILTIVDIALFLFSLLTKMALASVRSHHGPFLFLVTFTFILFSLSVFMTFRCVNISKLRNPFILDDLSHTVDHLYSDLSHNSLQADLDLQKSPFTVHYMWCRKSHFEYKHYLSIMSVVKVLRPDEIVFHYLEMPFVDRKGYFTWFEEIQQDIAMLSLRPIHHARYCGHDFAQAVIKDLDFPSPFGVFMTDDIAITDLSRSLVHHLVTDSLCLQYHHDSCSERQVPIEERKFQLFLVPQSEPYSLADKEGRIVLQCPIISNFNQADSKTFCVQLNQRLFPSDIWFQNSKFDAFVREIVYSVQKPLLPVQFAHTSIPRIAHIMMSASDGTFDPLCYSSVKSAFVIGQMEYVFLYSHSNPAGPLWEKLASDYAVIYIPLETSQSSTLYDLLLYGMQILLQHGGMLTTCDVIVQKQIESLRHSSTVSSVQKSEFHLMHHRLDFSVMFARPGSVFLKTFIPVLSQLRQVGSQRDIGAVGYHVYEQLPAAVYIETNLCSHHICTDSVCKTTGPAETNPRQAYTIKMHFESSKPVSLQKLSSVNVNMLEHFHELLI